MPPLTFSLSGVSGLELNQLNNPFGIARNPRTGTLYIADRDNHRIVSYATNEATSTVVAGGNGPGIGKRQLHSPIGVYFDAASDSLLIVNYGVHNIVLWKLGMTIFASLAALCTDGSSSTGEDSWTLVVGSPTGVSGMTSTLLNHPIGVTMDRWRNIYVADTSNHRIQFFLADRMNGSTIVGVTAVAGSNASHLRYPFTVAVDSQLNLYVSDTYNHRIQKFVLASDSVEL
jgi:DNA-binding beta-propeller fold protein YncE